MTRPTFPVIVHTQVIRQNGMTLYCPQISGVAREDIQSKINQTLYNETIQLVQQQFQQQNVDQFADMIGTYELKTNERYVLSLTLTNYAIAPMHANGLNISRGLTFDLKTGKEFTLEQLFQSGSNYRQTLTNLVQKQIKERDIPLVDSYPRIQPHQDFYVTDQTLVLFYQPLEITPHYFGSPVFPIPIYELESVIPSEGLLQRLMGM